MNNMPYVLVNVAMTIDGKLDTIDRKGATISSRADKQRVDELRASVDAVAVGGRTLLSEDPSLTVKSQNLRSERTARGQDENPVKVAIVSRADLSLQGHFMSSGPAKRIIYTTRKTTPEQVFHLESAGAQVFVCNEESMDLRSVLHSLHNQGVNRLMVEGGGTLIANFFKAGLVDEMTVYIAPRIFAGVSAPTLADGEGFYLTQAVNLQLESVNRFDEEGGILAHYLVHQNNY
jgi:2,5-diamino-6-(ribosylamino)-4(3H)-pyrimidinone 5'-phosphate reductase